GKAESEEAVQAAQHQAEQQVKEAEQQAQQLVEEAKLEAEKFVKEAVQSAKEEGKAEGFEDGKRESEEAVSAAERRAQKAMDETRRLRAELAQLRNGGKGMGMGAPGATSLGMSGGGDPSPSVPPSAAVDYGITSEVYEKGDYTGLLPSSDSSSLRAIAGSSLELEPGQIKEYKVFVAEPGDYIDYNQPVGKFIAEVSPGGNEDNPAKIKITMAGFPENNDNDEQVVYSMLMVKEFMLNLKELPSKDNPLVLNGKNENELMFLAAALQFVRKNAGSKEDLFPKSAIKYGGLVDLDFQSDVDELYANSFENSGTAAEVLHEFDEKIAEKHQGKGGVSAVRRQQEQKAMLNQIREEGAKTTPTGAPKGPPSSPFKVQQK
ncbi:MAG: ATP synthase F0 subunit B, partial [Legionella sp.]|nr:ATP synthase F0 subunit B [Legionella sp.]